MVRRVWNIIWKLGIVVGLILWVVGGTLLLTIQPGSSGVVASTRLADGSEYMVTQRCNWSLEPYTVAFYMRSAGGKWGWCYIDHQANRWYTVALAYDTNKDVVTVTERGIWRAALDRKQGTFAVGRPGRTLAAPQSYQEPEFPFPQ
ncbi:MAG TPA: hypothetical protein VMF06_14740 [Candidatus Limnocylindria bacterium]|jgi:hypothetical protein|nr:hypothetical protein [Candidatus Limnocylindria bacterium]